MAKKKPSKAELADKAYLVCDLGNSLIKMILIDAQGNFINRVDFPHAIRTSNIERFDATLNNRSGNRMLRAERFAIDDQDVAVGVLAEVGADKKKSGGPKYQKGYIDLLFISGALRLLPDGHDNLTVMVMHPPSDIQHAPTLRKSIGGRHAVKTINGEKIAYRVREVLSMDEPVGGVRHHLLDWGGITYRHEFTDERMALCIDVGGGVSSFTPFNRAGVVDYPMAEDLTFDIGIHNVMENLSRLIKSAPETREEFRAHRDSMLPFDSNMRRAIHTGIYNWNGRDIPMHDLRDEAVRPLVQRLQGEWENRILGVGFSPAYIVVTGGGGGVMFDIIIIDVLENYNRDNIFMVETDFSVIHFANVFGATKVQQAIIAQNLELI